MEGLLKGRRALVTGAGSGIGEGIALAMARAVRWGDPGYIEDSIARGRRIRRSLIELKQA